MGSLELLSARNNARRNGAVKTPKVLVTMVMTSARAAFPLACLTSVTPEPWDQLAEAGDGEQCVCMDIHSACILLLMRTR